MTTRTDATAVVQRTLQLYGTEHVFRSRYRSAGVLLMQARANPLLLLNHCFYRELAAVRLRTSAPDTAALRYRFWHDVVDNLSRTNPSGGGSPWATLVLQARGGRALAPTERAWFRSIVDGFAAWQSIDDSRALYTLDDLERACERTDSALLYLNLSAVGVVNTRIDAVAAHVARAMGLARLLADSPLLFAAHQLHLPIDLLAQHGISQHDAYNPGFIVPKDTTTTGSSDAFKDIVYTIATRAHDRLLTARKYATVDDPSSSQESTTQSSTTKTLFDTDSRVRLALLDVVPIQMYLADLQQHGFDAMDRTLVARDYATRDTSLRYGLGGFLRSTWRAYRVYRGREPLLADLG